MALRAAAASRCRWLAARLRRWHWGALRLRSARRLRCVAVSAIHISVELRDELHHPFLGEAFARGARRALRVLRRALVVGLLCRLLPPRRRCTVTSRQPAAASGNTSPTSPSFMAGVCCACSPASARAALACQVCSSCSTCSVQSACACPQPPRSPRRGAARRSAACPPRRRRAVHYPQPSLEAPGWMRSPLQQPRAHAAASLQ